VGQGERCAAPRLFVTAHVTTNIPTELLRTLITVVDLRSFTKAANVLGITQPAVSAQIKRLQFLLDTELLDKSAPGVTLTEKGELVVNYARRLLGINDQILNLVAPRSALPALRVGLPGDFGAAVLPTTVAQFQARSPNVRLQLRGELSENLLRDLLQDQLDLAVALTVSGPALDARHYWREETVWIRGPSMAVETGRRLPIVTLREGAVTNRLALSLLEQAARDYEIVFTAFSSLGLLAAVGAGLGVALIPRREVPSDLAICDDVFLPKPPDVYCGVYMRERVDSQVLEALADVIAGALSSRTGALAGEARESEPDLPPSTDDSAPAAPRTTS
jgi:DNA-binding transcriptional LysR family regulator